MLMQEETWQTLQQAWHTHEETEALKCVLSLLLPAAVTGFSDLPSN